MNEDLLLEAVYTFDKYCRLEKKSNNMYKINSELPSNILKATMRILIANKLALNIDGNYCIKDDQTSLINGLKAKVRVEVISVEMKSLQKRTNAKENNPFFKELSDIEYEIYSRCNFPIGQNIGKSLCEICDFSNSNILDIGGNSGGLGTAIINIFSSSLVTIVDKDIPCNVGNEFKKINQIGNIKFIKNDFFYLDLNTTYDYIILSNILHDYNDDDCISILKICKKHCKKSTKILIVEDILDNEIEPISVLEHGLRLSVNTINGQQRTIDELKHLMNSISMNCERKEKINDIQSLIIYEKSL